MKVIYDGDTGHFDGLSHGCIYDVVGENETQYIVDPNDHGAKSTIQKTKFKPLTNEVKRYRLFSALASMGNASHTMSQANTWVDGIGEIAPELMAEMVNVNAEIHRLQEKLREIRSGLV